MRSVHVRHDQAQFYSAGRHSSASWPYAIQEKTHELSDGKKNRSQNCLTVSTLKLDDVFPDVFGKPARSIAEYILAHPSEHFDVSSFVDGRCKQPIEEIQAAVDGAISKEQATKLCECIDHIDELKRHREQIKIEIYRLAEPYAYSLGGASYCSRLLRQSADRCCTYFQNWRWYVRVSNCEASLRLGGMLPS